MERLIVTGGAGFIGSNFVRHILRHSDSQTPIHVLVFDRLTYAGSLESLRDVESDPHYRFVQGDIADRDDVRAVFADFRPTAIVNFAAESHVDRSIDGPGEFVRTNINGTFELLEAARAQLAAQPDAPLRFLHVSTDEVYGSLGDEGLFHETTAYAPNSPYAASKAAADHLVRAYHHTYGLDAVITNCSNNFGPFQFPEKLIPLMIAKAVAGEPLPIYGDGLNVRDWLYVDDHCAGILLALRRGRSGEKYNLGGHGERTNLQVVDRLCEILQAQLPPADNPALADRAEPLDRYLDLKSFVRDRPGHDRRYAIDCTKATEELGWVPAYDFETGLAETIRWYLTNGAWCAAVTEGGYEHQRLGLAK